MLGSAVMNKMFSLALEMEFVTDSQLMIYEFLPEEIQTESGGLS